LSTVTPPSPVRATLESASVIFIDENGNGAGARLKKKKPGSGPG
jgi:hypothetical protein